MNLTDHLCIIITAAITCSSREDLCDDGKSCIMKYKFCNGREDCPDGSDEKASRCSSSSTTGKFIMVVMIMKNIWW